jgi:hypothetical protein
MLDNLWSQLGMSKESGTQRIKESFLSGYLNYYSSSKVKNLATGDRAAIAKDLMVYAKEYLSSPAFQQEYLKNRSQAKPIPSERKVKPKEEIRRQKIEETEKSIREAEQNMKTMKPDMAKAIAPVVEMLKKHLKDYRDPNSQMIELMYQGELMNKQNDERYYKESMERWEKEFPADPKEVIRKRLAHFIEVASTVDFNAELKTVGGKKKFVKAEYEYKSSEWKQIFRAGKEVIQPSVAFAQQWLNELK